MYACMYVCMNLNLYVCMNIDLDVCKLYVFMYLCLNTIFINVVVDLFKATEHDGSE